MLLMDVGETMHSRWEQKQ